MKRHCLTLDLKDDASLIAKYIEYHENVWPEVLDSIRDSGIMEMEIYSIENRLFMIIEVNEEFSFEKKSEMDANNPRVQDWEMLMWNYQWVASGLQGELAVQLLFLLLQSLFPYPFDNDQSVS